MARAYLLCISRVATSVTSLGGFCNCTEHVYSPESEGTRSSISRRLPLEANSFVIVILSPFTMLVPLCLHDIEAIVAVFRNQVFGMFLSAYPQVFHCF